MPMIEKSEENIQKALNLTPEEFQEQCSNIDVLADYGYFSYEQVEKAEDKENITLYLPDKGLASQDKDKLRRPCDRKKNNKKRYGKDNMTWNEENHCYICPEGQKLLQKKIYHQQTETKYYTTEQTAPIAPPRTNAYQKRGQPK